MCHLCGWNRQHSAAILVAVKATQEAHYAKNYLAIDIGASSGRHIEKSAEIYVKVLSMGGGIIRQTITDDDLRAIAHDFGVTLNENFLN